MTASDIAHLEGCWLGYLDLDFFGGKCLIGLDIEIRSANKIEIAYHRISGAEDYQKCRQVTYRDGLLCFELSSGGTFTLVVDLESRSMSGDLKTKDWIFPTYLEFDLTITDIKKNPRFFKARKYSYQVPEQLNDGLTSASVNDVGIISDRIEVLMNLILNETYENIRSILVIKDSKLIIEEYFWQKTIGGFPYFLGRDEPQNIYSATRAFTASLLGIALDQNLIPSEKQELLHYFPEYENILKTENKENISLEHLLTMESGFQWEQKDKDNYSSLFDQIRSQAGFPILQYLFERPMSTIPGETYVYNNELSTTIGEIVKRSAYMPLVEFADKNLFNPLGISHYSWHVYPDGLTSGGNGLRMKPRDMAKFGFLFVNGGHWNGIQIISEEWIEKSFKRQTALGNVPYGYHWFLNTFKVNNQRIIAPNARGHYGQFIFVFPTLDMVCVVTSAADETHLWDQSVELIAKHLLPAVIPDTEQFVATKKANVEKKVLDDYRGIYQHEEDRFGMLARKARALYYKPPGHKFYRLSAESDQRFFSERKDIALTCIKGQDGNISHYTVVFEGIEEQAIKIDSQNGGIKTQNIVVLPRTLLLLFGLFFAIVFILNLSGLLFSRLRRAKQKKLSWLSQTWTIITILAGICMIFLILKDAIILEEILNLGTYIHGWDEILVIWIYLILSAGVVLVTLRTWVKRTGSIFGRSLLLVVSAISVCLIVILQRIGLLVLFP